MPKPASYLANGLVGAGALVGLGTAAAFALGYDITLSPAMIHLLVFKGLGAMSVGLIIAGSWIGRKTRDSTNHLQQSPDSLTEGRSDSPALNEASQVPTPAQAERVQTRERI